ncbi:uncharacterized protein [Oscarella lobularis]|uniref:uncharacterized protein isoform X2 n=1 Tax=Oscarella lobularis TaxID=121494 RepID=UPI0033143868
MKVVGLISGGKDSCFNLLKCLAEGHQLVAVANLCPPKGENELDSYMFQTVGHEAVPLLAEAFGSLPFYRRTISGQAISTGKTYLSSSHDEVEDLYQLLRSIQSEICFDGVSVGAIRSDYQRVRVENVCGRLGLTCLAYLWRVDQKILLEEMICSGVDAIVIKTAAMGLSPSKHLGKSIRSLHSKFCEMNDSFGFHVCGEGGEYETLVVDCPLYEKRFVIDESEIVMHSDDAFAPVAYLVVKKFHLEEKDKDSESLEKTLLKLKQPLPPHAADDMPSDENREAGCSFLVTMDQNFSTSGFSLLQKRTIENSDFCWISGIAGQMSGDGSASAQALAAMEELTQKLKFSGMTSGHVILVYLYIRKMSEYAAINDVYKTVFDVNPPIRVCVEANLPEGQALLLNCLACKCSPRIEKNVMHVQSISHWAPANIGPYSQAMQLDSTVYVAGQIGLIPGSMTLIGGGVVSQARLCLCHTTRILNAHYESRGGLALGHVVQATCFVTDRQYVRQVKEEWGKIDQMCHLVFVAVPALPKGALVEFHSIADSRAEDFSRGSNSWSSESVLHQAHWVWMENLGYLTFSAELLDS